METRSASSADVGVAEEEDDVEKLEEERENSDERVDEREDEDDDEEGELESDDDPELRRAESEMGLRSPNSFSDSSTSCSCGIPLPATTILSGRYHVDMKLRRLSAVICWRLSMGQSKGLPSVLFWYAVVCRSSGRIISGLDQISWIS